MTDIEFQREALRRDMKWCLDKLNLIEVETDEVVREGLNLALCLKLVTMGSRVEKFVLDSTHYYNEKHHAEEAEDASSTKEGQSQDKHQEDEVEDWEIEADAGDAVRQD